LTGGSEVRVQYGVDVDKTPLDDDRKVTIFLISALVVLIIVLTLLFSY
jgi:hypothetical protein